jgi:soluble lytic murein transglycosylase
VGREHPLSSYRVVPLVLVAVLAAIAVAGVYGPTWYQRMFHPLSYESVIAKRAHAAGVDPYLVAAVVNVESGFRADVVSSAGAVGLMQVKPSTAEAVARTAGMRARMDVSALSDPDTNVRIGTLYLAELLARYGGDVTLALAAYNGGMTNADRWAEERGRSGGALIDAIDFPETADYVDEVETQAAVYRRLYPGVLATAVK